MAHKRKAIRQALVTLLTNATDADDRVYSNRSRNLPTEKLPAIIVHDGSENGPPKDISSKVYIRTWNVAIEVKVADTEGADEKLDDVLNQIEDVISANRNISGQASTSLYSSTDEPDFDSTGETTVVTTRINYEIKYFA